MKPDTHGFRKREELSRSGSKAKAWNASRTFLHPQLRVESNDLLIRAPALPLLRLRGLPGRRLCLDISLRLSNTPNLLGSLPG